MTVYLYQDIVRDQYLRPIGGVLVAVLDASGNTAVLTDSGGVPATNPVETATDGSFSFYAAAGSYTLQYRYGGRLVETDIDFVGPPLQGLTPATIALLAQPGTATGIGSAGPSTVQTDLDSIRGDVGDVTTYTIPYSHVGYAGAKGRLLGDKLGYDLYSLADFVTGPIELCNPFDALNKATGADQTYTGNDSYLAREIRIPGNLTFPNQNRSVFVRKGQTLTFLGGREHDFSALVNNTVPAIRMGVKSDGSIDPGGLPPRITGLLSIGGPAAYPLIENISSQGSFLDQLFLTAPGLGIALGGTDCVAGTITIDQAQTGMSITGQTHQIGRLFFYNTKYDIQVADNTFDVTIDKIFTEYPQICSLFFATGATNIKNFSVGKHRGVMNAQYSTFIGMVRCQAATADILIDVGSYRNTYSYAVIDAQGSNLIEFGHLEVNGLKSNPAFNQSTTSGAIIAQASSIDVREGRMRNLQSQPIQFLGPAASALRLNDVLFSGNTGGSSEIGYTKPNGGLLRMSNVESSRTLASGTGPITIINI